VSARALHPSDDGFSFIELLAYMAIAALLILAAIPQFSSYRERAAISNMQNDLQIAAQAVEAEYATALRIVPVEALGVKTSRGVTLASGIGDGNVPMLGFLRLNSGETLPALSQMIYGWNGDSYLAREYPAAQWFMGAENQSRYGQALEACGYKGGMSYSTGDIYFASCEGGVLRYGQFIAGGKGFLVAADGSSGGADQAGFVGPLPPLNNFGGSFEKLKKVDPTGESYCINATSTGAPGKTWSYSSTEGLRAGEC